MQQAPRSAPAAAWLLLLATVVLAWGLPAAPSAAPADHLALSEVVVQTRLPVSQFGSKFIEIVNPTAASVPLDSVYITDATFNSPPTYYYDIVQRGRIGIDRPGGGGTGGDFHARFPDGTMIEAGDALVVSIIGSTEYQSAYGRLPDFELFEDALVPDTVPELVEVFPGSIGRGLGSAGTNIPDLNSGGETIVLYRWDGKSDRVQDLDYIIWGTVTSVRADKTGVRRDGPDADADSTAYLDDTPVSTQQPISSSSHNYGGSYQRRLVGGLPDEGAETHTGGNGVTGHNETSEPLALSWQVTTTQSPPSQPTTLHAPAPIITAATLSPESPTAGLDVTVTVTVVANGGVDRVRVYWSLAGGTFTEVSCTNTSGDVWSGPIPGQVAQTEVAWYVIATGANDASATHPVVAPVYVNRYTVSGEPPPPPESDASLLLLTEVCTQPATREYVEICNPGEEDVDLSDYYLTDAIHSPLSQYYWKIVSPNPSQTTVGGGAYNDFHARFPDGATIAAGDTIVVSITGSSGFEAVFGFKPDFELVEDGGVADDVPDMREVFAGSNAAGPPYNTAATLTDGGECVVLYFWDGASDLVTDIDVFFWGTDDRVRFSKTGVSIDGPDEGGATTTYQPDTDVGLQLPFATEHSPDESYQRLDISEGTELNTGGNGVLGHDETSENMDVTWGIAPSDPSRPPAVSRASQLLLTEMCTQASSQEFIEVWNPGTAAIDLSNFYLTDATAAGRYYWQIVLPDPSESTVGGGDAGDFHARFPEGATIAAGDTVTISIAGSEAFRREYGFSPDYELFEDGGADDVPDMREVFPGSIDGVSRPDLRHEGESAVLYYWDGETDLVTDIDVFFWGANEDSRFSKTGVSIDGPDEDSTPTAYQADTAIAEQDPLIMTQQLGQSYQRQDVSEGEELDSGGNGVLGQDETSENMSVTWGVGRSNPGLPSRAGVALQVPARTFLPLLGQTFPVRFRTLAGAQTLVRVFDLDGRLVVTLFDSRFDGTGATASGQFTERTWNGRDAQMELVPAGLYIVHLSVVDSESGEQQTKTAPVVVATRMSR